MSKANGHAPSLSAGFPLPAVCDEDFGPVASSGPYTDTAPTVKTGSGEIMDSRWQMRDDMCRKLDGSDTALGMLAGSPNRRDSVAGRFEMDSTDVLARDGIVGIRSPRSLRTPGPDSGVWTARATQNTAGPPQLPSSSDGPNDSACSNASSHYSFILYLSGNRRWNARLHSSIFELSHRDLVLDRDSRRVLASLEVDKKAQPRSASFDDSLQRDFEMTQDADPAKGDGRQYMLEPPPVAMSYTRNGRPAIFCQTAFAEYNHSQRLKSPEMEVGVQVRI